MELRELKRILVIDLGGIGDLLLAQPALRALRQQYTGAVIDMLVVKRSASLVSSYGIIDGVFVWERPLLKRLHIMLRLRSNRYDLVVNLRTMSCFLSALKMFFLFCIVNGRVSAGRDTNKTGFFFKVKVAETEPGMKYEMEYDIDVVRAIGCQVTDRTIKLNIGDEERAAVDALFKKRGTGLDALVIGVHPGGMPSRRWPLHRYRQVMDRIYTVYHCIFVVTGGADEVALTRELCCQMECEVIDTTGKLSVLSTAALIQRCALFISNDTGTMHIAAVLGIPQIAIFGPGQLNRFDSRLINPKAVVLYNRTTCSPCNHFSCRSLRCLKGISVDMVVESAFKLLATRGIK